MEPKRSSQNEDLFREGNSFHKVLEGDICGKSRVRESRTILEGFSSVTM